MTDHRRVARGRGTTLNTLAERYGLTGETAAKLETLLDLLLGERTLDVADKYGLSPGRVSQLRRDFMQDWQPIHLDGSM